MSKIKPGRFKVGDYVYIPNWYHGQPKNTVVKAKVVDLVSNSWLNWIKYEIQIGKGKFLIGDKRSPDVWGAKIFKSSKKEIYEPRGRD